MGAARRSGVELGQPECHNPGTLIFVIVAFVGMYAGRRIGWALSRNFLYSANMTAAVIACIAWGMLIACGVRALIMWQSPFWLLRWIFGYFMGAYVAVPNYGLLVESTIPHTEMRRHDRITMLPLWTYILTSLLFAHFAHLAGK